MILLPSARLAWTTLCLAVSTALAAASGLVETVLDVKLPKPLSDHTGTLVGTKVFIAGGCDDPFGNTWHGSGINMFLCGSVSSSFFVFDLVNQTFQNLTDMPQARYRHAAAAGDNKIFIHGGRTLEDAVISSVDIYDIEDETWSSIELTDDKYQLSDHTGFSNGDYAYFAGGWTVNYAAVATTFRINTKTSNAVTGLVVEDRANMVVARGDIHSAFTDSNAITAGGFTHLDGYCIPHIHGESYSFANDEWTTIANLTVNGAERSLAAIGDSVYALGGEKQIEGICNVPEAEKPQPGERTILLKTVERYDVDTDTWERLADLPAHIFRYVALGYEDVIWSFGGQLEFQPSCNCFKTSDRVATYELSSSAVALGMTSGIVALVSTLVAALWAF